MCFSQGGSGFIALVGLLFVGWSHFFIKNSKLTAGLAFFVSMEVLQWFQYFWIDDCDSLVNRALTLAGFVHICAQPYFTHLLSAATTTDPTLLRNNQVTRKLCAAAGVFLFASWLLSPWQRAPPTFSCPSTDWIRAYAGEGLCTYSGARHLAWSVPLMDPTYLTPSTAIHSFFTFAPFFVLGDWEDFFYGLFLLATGPVLAMLITPNLQEQASIWCFFSVAQLAVVVVHLTLKAASSKRRPTVPESKIPTASSYKRFWGAVLPSK